MKLKFWIALIFTANFYIGFAQPSNDDCIAALDLGAVPVCKPFDVFFNTNATASNIVSPTCFQGGANPDRDVWFTFQTPAGIPANQQNYILTISGVDNPALRNPQVAVYRGDCQSGSLAEWDCATAVNGTNQVELNLNNMIPGLTWYVRVNDYSASGTPNAGSFNICIEEAPVVLLMGTDVFSDECNGMITDDGGPGAGYSNSANQVFTLCPSDPHACISLDISQFASERGLDYLRIFSGSDINGLEMARLSGILNPRTLELPAGCVTLQFVSDGTVRDEGFSISWTCSANACANLDITSCDDPVVVPSLPFSATESTCNSATTIDNYPCALDDIYGPDYVFAYDSPGDECIDVTIDGATLNTVLSLNYGCPELVNDCIDLSFSSFFNPEVSIENAYLELPGRYYFVVTNVYDCTDFTINIKKIDCKPRLDDLFTCEGASNLNGCDPSEPKVFSVFPGAGDSTLFTPGVNDGCWEVDQNPVNFIWLYFRANADGKFGFLMSSDDPNETSDLDFQVWGPVPSKEELCNFVKSNQPIRSSYALPNDTIDLTGMVDTLPFAPFYPINDVCEDATFTDGFVRSLDVQEGEYYMILLNDYSGMLYSAELQIDLSPTSPGVLDGMEEEFSVKIDTSAICPGDQVQLTATGGNFYEWLPSPNLSCTYCPNPMVPVGRDTVTYEVIIENLCKRDTLSIDVAPTFNVNLGPDIQVCINEDPFLNAVVTGSPVDLQWLNFADSMSCYDCAQPQVYLNNSQGFYIYVIDADFGSCMIRDSVIIEIINFLAPETYFIGDTVACKGMPLNLGVDTINGFQFEWTDPAGNVFSNDQNPLVIADSTTDFHIRLFNQFCDVEDRMHLDVFEIPPSPMLDDVQLCPGDSLVLDAMVDTSLNFVWSNGDSSFYSTEPNPVFVPGSNFEIITLWLQSHPVCPPKFATILVESRDTPSVNLIYDGEIICPFDTAVVIADIRPAGGRYLWDNGQTGLINTLTPEMTTAVGITYISPFGCDTIRDSVIVLVNDFTLDSIGVAFEGDSIYVGTEFTLSLNSPDNLNGYQFSWTLDGIDTRERGMQFETSLSQPGEYTYTVQVVSPLGCIKTITRTIFVYPYEYKIPNVFYPGSMNFPENRVFKPTIKGAIKVKKMQVFNSWGDLVFDTSFRNVDFWDGTHNGEEGISDVYFYRIILEYPDGSTVLEEGDVTLLR
ncbi:MAG: gliding motility-associated C-terminal domain-containing protein [Saprospiraceae bacterium]